MTVASCRKTLGIVAVDMEVLYAEKAYSTDSNILGATHEANAIGGRHGLRVCL